MKLILNLEESLAIYRYARISRWAHWRFTQKMAIVSAVRLLFSVVWAFRWHSSPTHKFTYAPTFPNKYLPNQLLDTYKLFQNASHEELVIVFEGQVLQRYLMESVEDDTSIKKETEDLLLVDLIIVMEQSEFNEIFLKLLKIQHAIFSQ